MTHTRQDEAIAAYLSEHGRNALEAYGFWWALLETIADGMTAKEPEKCSACYSLEKWARETDTSTRKALKFIKSLVKLELVEVRVGERDLTKFQQSFDQSLSNLCQNYSQTSSDLFQITIRNLLKYRDEYQKKSGQTPQATPDKLPAKIQIQIQRESKPISSSDDDGVFALTSGPISQNGKYSAVQYFETVFWPQAWRKVGKGDALKAFRRVAKTEAAAERITAAAKVQGPLLIDAALKSKREALHPSTWLNGGRFDDELTEIEIEDEF